MALSDVTRDGLRHVRPDREAAVGSAGPDSQPHRHRPTMPASAGEQDGRSYYGLPVLNKPTWEPLDIAGYLFLGGLAGSSSALAAAAELTGRRALARPLEYGAAGAISLSLAALVHDLGRPSRFYNMLRVFKATSPMSVGSWILSVYGPAALGAAALGLLGDKLPGPLGSLLSPTVVGRLSRGAVLTAALTGPAVATYTAVLVANTAVPAWHAGRNHLPFVFAGSACSAGGGLGLLTAPVGEAGPARRLGVGGAVVELATIRSMRSRMGLPSETFEQGRAGRLMKAAEVLTAAGVVGASAGRRNRLVSAVAGGCLLAGSAFSRFGIFYAGVQSAEDPKYTVEPQKARAGSAG